MPTTLVVTNDFPPRIGGIETFVAAACEILGHDVVVLTSTHAGATAHDAQLDYEVVRRSAILLPTPGTAVDAARLLVDRGCTRVLFGAAAPLSLLGPALRRSGAERVVALSHGHETWWATLPGARSALRRMVAGVDVLGTISDYTERRIAAALPPEQVDRLRRIPPPVDPAFFAVGAARPDRRVRRVLTAGRLVRQKGVDTLIAAWRRLGPNTDLQLLVAGDGPMRSELQRAAASLPPGAVRFLGTIPHEAMPALMATADAFALPMRTRLAGLNPEGLGLVAAEAAAAGLPVIIGRSGGAPETVLPDVSGWVVDSDDVAGLAGRLTTLAHDADLARRMGAAGRQHARERFARDRVAIALRL